MLEHAIIVLLIYALLFTMICAIKEDIAAEKYLKEFPPKYKLTKRKEIE